MLQNSDLTYAYNLTYKVQKTLEKIHNKLYPFKKTRKKIIHRKNKTRKRIIHRKNKTRKN